MRVFAYMKGRLAESDDQTMIITYFTLIEEESDREKFERVYKEYRLQMLHVAASILKDNSLAEDAVHNAFVHVAENISRLDFGRDASALMYTIARHEAISILRKVSSEQQFIENSGRLICPGRTSTEASYEYKAEVESIARYVAQLPEDYASIFTLRFRHQMKTREIAALLGLSDDVVRKRIQRMKQVIEKMHDRMG